MLRTKWFIGNFLGSRSCVDNRIQIMRYILRFYYTNQNKMDGIIFCECKFFCVAPFFVPLRARNLDGSAREAHSFGSVLSNDSFEIHDFRIHFSEIRLAFSISTTIAVSRATLQFSALPKSMLGLNAANHTHTHTHPIDFYRKHKK